MGSTVSFIKRQVNAPIKYFVNSRVQPDAPSKRFNDYDSDEVTVRQKHVYRKEATYSLHNDSYSYGDSPD